MQMQPRREEQRGHHRNEPLLSKQEGGNGEDCEDLHHKELTLSLYNFAQYCYSEMNILFAK